MYASGGFGGIRSMERYDISTDTWAEMDPMQVDRREHGMCCVGGDLYVVGGIDTGSSVFKYEVSSNTWSAVESMPTARYGLGVCDMGVFLYCIGGGTDDESEVAVAERYDTESGRWTSLAPMPTARTYPAVFVLQGKIYVAGGFAQDDRLDVVERYDPGTDTWDNVTRLDVTISGELSGCSMKTEVNYFDWLLSGGREYSTDRMGSEVSQ